MNDILNVPADMKRELSAIAAETDPNALMAELTQCFEITVNHVIKLAALVRRLECLGVEIELQVAILPYIRRIAYGQIIPELFVAMQGDASLLARTSSLPIPDQKKIASGEPLKVMEHGGDHRMVVPLQLTNREIKQVFGKGRLRSDAEQIGWLRDQEESRRLKSVSVDVQDIILDKKRLGINVRGRFVSATDMAHYLAELTPRSKRR